MKKVLLGVFLLLSTSLFSQRSYDDFWAEIDTLELNGKVESANEKVKELLQFVASDKEYGHYIKAKLYHYKYYQINHENSNDYILKDVNSSLAKLPAPYKNILNSYKAEFLQNYYRNNRWNLRNREKVNDPDPEDMESWSLGTLRDSILQTFDKSLEQRKRLVNFQNDDITELLNEDFINRNFRPSLLDLLSARVLDAYTNRSYFVDVFTDADFNWNNPDLLKINEFENFKIPDGEDRYLQSLKLYQVLEKHHRETGNEAALAYWTVERLEYVTSRSENSKEFLNSLENLLTKLSEDDALSYLNFRMAEKLYSERNNGKTAEKFPNADYLIKAMEKLDHIIKNYPNTIAYQNALSLKNLINVKTLSIKTPKYLSVSKPGRLFLNYKNIDTVYYAVLKVPKSFKSELATFEYSAKSRDSMISKRVNDSLMISLPGKKDYNEHSTEIAFKGQPSGTYLIYVSDGTGNYNYGFTEVTNLALSQIDYDHKNSLFLKDRQTGKNLKNVAVYEERDDNGETVKIGETDDDGMISLPRLKSSEYYRSMLHFTKDGDSMSTNYHRGYYWSPGEDIEEVMIQTQIFLDRAIYRPGQTVHFKGVLLQHRADTTKVVPNEYIPVIIEDPNGEVIYETRFETNEFGSFNGNFQLPSTGITGRFNIYAEEDYESESDFWNYYWDNGDIRENYVEFRVEEYKRPTFEVVFDSIKNNYELMDTISVGGNVTSFMGASLPGAKIKYEVTRERFIAKPWFRYYTENTTIFSDSITADENGNFKLAFPAKTEQLLIDDPDLIYKYTVTVQATDVSGETRENNTSLRVGNKNLLASINMENEVNLNDSLKIAINATNLNDVKIPVDGTFKVYKLNDNDRILGNRLWEAPEFNLISEEEFIKMFPNEPYGNVLNPVDRAREELVYTSQFQSDGYFEEILIPENWKPGTYLLEVQLESENGKEFGFQPFQVFDPQNKTSALKAQLITTILNDDPFKDGFAELKLQSAYKELYLDIIAFNGNSNFFQKKVKLKGSESVKIPLDQIKASEFKFLVTGIKNGMLIRSSEVIKSKKTDKALEITTETFRNKIDPGIEETWSFKIGNDLENASEIEVLASMYDASLDQFKTAEWSTRTNFSRSYIDYPAIRNHNLGIVENLKSTFPRTYFNYRSLHLRFDELDLFGFDFGNINSYIYRNYLQNKRAERKFAKSEKAGNLRGRVTDSDGFPLPGVNVVIQGTDTGTQTDFDGNFSINAAPGAILSFSQLGFVTQKKTVKNTNNIYVTLEADRSALNEVVVTGYGVEEEAELTGKVAGVEIARNQSLGYSVKIRGAGTITENVSLLVVDGEIRNVEDFNSDDIADIQVLKGSEATALYGARAANGVIIITTKTGLQDLQKVEARQNLDETAFFYPDLKVDENGKVQFSFTSPEALTSWKLRLLGHTRDWTTGSLTRIVQTQKELSIAPNSPRFLRSGDSIVFKARITNMTSKPMIGTAMLQLFDAISMKPVDTIMGNSSSAKQFKTMANGTQAVTWKLMVPDTLEAVKYRVLAKSGDFSDGEENILPVLKNSMLVKESIPFLVRPGETETYVLRNLKENNSETLKNHQFSIEYTSSPAWSALQSLPYLMEYEHECAEQVFSRLFSNLTAHQIVTSSPEIKAVFDQWKSGDALESDLVKNEDLKNLLLAETPWVLDAASETAQKKRVAQLFDTESIQKQTAINLQKLQTMQKSSGAFPWFSGGNENFYITSHIVAGFGRLEKLGIEADAATILKNAIQFLDKQFIQDYEKMEASKKSNFYTKYWMLNYLYARSYHVEKHPFPEKIDQILENILDAQKADWNQFDLANKAKLSQVLYRFGKKETAKLILESLKQTAVKSEDFGMYWKSNESSWRTNTTATENQALIVEAFSEISQEDKIIDELKIWLLQNKRTNHWSNTKSTTAACYALLMEGRNWLEINDAVQIKVGGKDIPKVKLEEVKEEAGTGYMKIDWKANEIEKTFAEVQVSNNTKNPGYGGVYWQYFEDLDQINEHSESPFTIEKELYLNAQGKELEKITSEKNIKIGDLVTVRLVIRTQSEMEFIHIKDLRASGFEPTAVLSEYKYKEGAAYYQSTKDAATHFFFDRLPKGTNVLEYTVRANNAGAFSNGVTTIENMYAPEFSGHSKGSRIKIEE